MKTFILKFYSNHDRQLSRYITMKAQAQSLERLLPRVKKILKELEKLPNPIQHNQWFIQDIKEVIVQ